MEETISSAQPLERVRAIRVVDQVSLTELSSAIDRISEFQKLVQERLRSGLDYGIIPGTGRRTLLKPGAEKICMLLGLRSEFEIMDQARDFESGFFQYQVKCKLYWGDALITEGMGAANTRETKYRTRDAYTLDNTILKMGKKRALVDAALMVGSLSDIFTQDLEDLEPDDAGQADKGPKRESRREVARGRATGGAEGADSPASGDAVRAVYNMGRSAGLSDDELRGLLRKVGLSTTRGMGRTQLEQWKRLITDECAGRDAEQAGGGRQEATRS